MLDKVFSLLKSVYQALIKAADFYAGLGKIWKMISGVLTIAVIISPFLGISFTPDRSSTIDLNTIGGCKRGSVIEMHSFSDVKLIGGAQELRICDTTSFTASDGQFAIKLAEKYPGCLDFDSTADELSVRKFPKAVCKHVRGIGTMYFCNGASKDAQIKPHYSDLTKTLAELPDCTKGSFELNNTPRDYKFE